MNTEAPSQTQYPLGRVVIVLPTYDEKDNIVALTHAISKQQNKIDNFELVILISDGHSKDGTIEIGEALAAEHEHIHFIDVNRRGIGAALYLGFKYAIDELDADVLVEMDSDFQHNPDDLPILLAPIAEGYDVVVGSRFLPDSQNNMPAFRRVLSVGANGVLRLALGLRNITEITTSFRAIRKATFLELKEDDVPWWEPQSFIAVPVFLVRMLENGAKATEVRMTMHPRVNGYSKMVYWRYVRDVLTFAVKDRLGLN
ncbi:MAG: glycosyltransferase [Phototrophicaceae bacterium]